MLPNKRPKFSPSNIAEQEQNFIRMHNVAMGYEPRTNSGTSIDTDIIAIANDALNSKFLVPSSRHSTFQDLIRAPKQEKFHCFKEPVATCEC